MIITIKNIMRNLNIHGMIITILDQQFNQVSVPIVIVTILLNSLSPGNADVFPVVSANPPLRSVFFGSLLQAFKLWSLARIQRGGGNRERGRGGYEGTLAVFPAHVFCAVSTI